MNEKSKQLANILPEKVAIAFSGGVDSTFLLAFALQAGRDVLALSIISPFLSEEEVANLRDLRQGLGAQFVEIPVDVLSMENVVANPPDRCYPCKKALFTAMQEIATGRGYTLCDGSNASDLSDYRPGMRAIKELGIRSPLLEAGLDKADIRALSREMGLKTHDAPSAACLASRIPYGVTITKENLLAVGKAEEGLHQLGFANVRVRYHGDVARLEFPQGDMARALAQADEIHTIITKAGFTFAALDLKGYQMGSLNALINKDKNKEGV